MKISDEIRQQINAKVEEINNLTNAGKIDEAYTEKDNLKKLRQTLAIEVEKENVEFDNFMKGDIYKMTPNAPQDAAKLRISALNKLVLNPLRGEYAKPLTDEERNAYFNSGEPGQPGQVAAIPTKGGYLVPEEQLKTLQELRKDIVALKNYVRVVQTNSPSGRWPVYKQQYLDFRTVAELKEIPDSDLVFAEKTFVVEDQLAFVPISNILIDDSTVDIIGVVGESISQSAINKENKIILEPLQKLITGDTAEGISEAPTITSYKSLNTAIFKTLDRIYYPQIKIFTNQSGYLWLENLQDENHRPLIQSDSTEAPRYFYRGKEIIVLPDISLPDAPISGKNYAPILIGDLNSYLTYFERKGLELAASREILFKFNAYAMRAIFRSGIVVTDEDAMTALKVEV